MYLIPLILALLILSAFSYFILLTINNVIWGYKGIPTDKESPAYRLRKRSLKLISIPLSILVLVVIGLVRTDSNAKNQSSELKEQLQMLAQKSGRSSSNFQKALSGLDKIRDLDTIPKINEAITIIERVQLLFYQANQDSDDLSDFISRNKIQLQKEGLGVFLDMEGLRSETYFTHRKALREYFNKYKAMLEYSTDNLEAIIKGKEPQSGTYKQLYLMYRNALDVHNEAYLQHMKFIDQYLREHPALVEFIAKARQDLRKE